MKFAHKQNMDKRAHVKTCQVGVASTWERTGAWLICATFDLGEVDDGPTETWVTIAIM